MPADLGWVCESTVVPIIKYFSASDQTDIFLGIKCYKVDKRVEGLSWRDLLSARKVAQLIDGLLP